MASKPTPAMRAKVALSGQAEVDARGARLGGDTHGVRRIERETELEGEDVDGAGGNDGQRHIGLPARPFSASLTVPSPPMTTTAIDALFKRLARQQSVA